MSDEPDDIEKLFARELAGFTPAFRSGSSAPLGAHIVHWRTLSDTAAVAEWKLLREWVEWLTVRYNIAISVIPVCWWKHGALVEELSAMHTAHLVAFDESDSGFGPIGWHERLAIALPRISRAYGGGCSNGHRANKPRSWEHATDDQEWETWITQTHAT